MKDDLERTSSLNQPQSSKVCVWTASRTAPPLCSWPKYPSSGKSYWPLSTAKSADIATTKSSLLENSPTTELWFFSEFCQKKISIDKSSSLSILKFTLRKLICKSQSMAKRKSVPLRGFWEGLMMRLTSTSLWGKFTNKKPTKSYRNSWPSSDNTSTAINSHSPSK